MDSSLDKIIDEYDIEAAGNAFARHIYSGAEPGSFFRDDKGLKWKYLALVEESSEYVASHGEFCIVVTLTQIEGTKFKVEVELKQRSIS